MPFAPTRGENVLQIAHLSLGAGRAQVYVYEAADDEDSSKPPALAFEAALGALSGVTDDQDDDDARRTFFFFFSHTKHARRRGHSLAPVRPRLARPARVLFQPLEVDLPEIERGLD